MLYSSPLTCVWEITMACNMRCGHCGSSCSKKLPGELTKDEAFAFIDQCAEIGLKWITLSGGEPTTRKDLPELVQRLTEKNIAVNMISNAWVLDQVLLEKLKKAQISIIAISIDGTQAIHDEIRREGAYERAQNVFRTMHALDMQTGCVTTVTKKNIDILPELKDELIKLGVRSWQLQIGLPMGNLKEKPDWVLDPEQMDDLLEFCSEASREGLIKILPADCVGYYTKIEEEIRQRSFQTSHPTPWDGCNAGIRGFGLLHDGFVLGCTSIRSKEFIEGNIKETPLVEIWNGENSFNWRRKLTKESIKGNCSSCNYGKKCLGGCPNTRLTMGGDIYAENKYCSYSLFLDSFRKEIEAITDEIRLRSMLDALKKESAFQQCSMIIDRLETLNIIDIELYEFKGFCDYVCGNYAACVNANEKALALGTSPYALKGLGVAMHKQGFSEAGVKFIEQAATLTLYKDQDIINDLLLVKNEMSQAGL